MAYDELLESWILSTIHDWKNVTSKKRFGGVCHLLQGNLFCGTY